MAKKKAPKQQAPEAMIDSLSRQQFVDLLTKKRDEYGSVQKLSDAMGVPIRNIWRWVQGEGPSYPKMVRAYDRLKEL